MFFNTDGGNWANTATIVLSGTNTLTGGPQFIIGAGTLRLESPGMLTPCSLISVGRDYRSSATLLWNVAETVTNRFYSRISNIGSHMLSMNTNGTTTLTGKCYLNSATGTDGANWRLSAVANGTLVLAGVITDQKNTSEATIITNTPRGLIKIGAGTVVLANGGNEYQGGTIVSNGTLLVQNTSGSATGTNVVNVFGGTLGGTGQLFSAVSVYAGASLAPGGTNTVGNLTVLNSVTLTSGATYHVNIGATGSDKLTLIGALQLNGATLQVSLADGFTPPAGSVYTIATGFNSLDATPFAGLPDGQLFQVGGTTFAIRYNSSASPKTITLTPFTGTMIMVR